ncbi:hypothetical protein GF357_03485 [Candidatus Dojkabacteria bacterium]|nr:hypothetical protein [Candidatus Dojkabacteria bacterium]
MAFLTLILTLRILLFLLPDTVGVTGFGVMVVLVLLVSLFFYLIGWLTKKGFIAASIVGLVLYIFDLLLVLLVGDIISAGFHVYQIVIIIVGISAFFKIKKKENTMVNAVTSNENGEDFSKSPTI